MNRSVLRFHKLKHESLKLNFCFFKKRLREFQIRRKWFKFRKLLSFQISAPETVQVRGRRSREQEGEQSRERTTGLKKESHSLVPIHFEAVIFVLNTKKENPEEAFNSINASLDWNERLQQLKTSRHPHHNLSSHYFPINHFLASCSFSQEASVPGNRFLKNIDFFSSETTKLRGKLKSVVSWHKNCFLIL